MKKQIARLQTCGRVFRGFKNPPPRPPMRSANTKNRLHLPLLTPPHPWSITHPVRVYISDDGIIRIVMLSHGRSALVVPPRAQYRSRYTWCLVYTAGLHFIICTARFAGGMLNFLYASTYMPMGTQRTL